MTGCRGCLGGLVLLALLAGPIVLLAPVLGAVGLPTGGLALAAVTLLVVGASVRPRGDPRPGPAMPLGTIGRGARRPHAPDGAARPDAAVRTALARDRERSQPAHLDARRSDVPASGLRERDLARRNQPAVQPGATAGEGVRRARDHLPARLRFGVLRRDGFRCRYCGRPGSAPGVVLHVDHVVPIAAGGATTEGNLLTACEECNLGKATRAVVGVGG